MAEHEIPFTRNDLLLQLSGDGGRLLDRFLAACGGRIKGLEVIEGEEFTALRLLGRMANEDLCTFSVPWYFYEAWRAACKDLGQLVGDEKDIVRFHGVELVSWDREFIVANVDLTGSKDEVAQRFDTETGLSPRV